MGMSIADFESLTPTEFDSIYKAWERTHLREDWERVRFLASAILTPHTKKRLKATDIVRFPWDEHHGPKVSKEEAKSKFDNLIKNLDGRTGQIQNKD